MSADVQTLDANLGLRLGDDQARAELASVQRTQAEKAMILARLTLQLAALDFERRNNGDV